MLPGQISYTCPMLPKDFKKPSTKSLGEQSRPSNNGRVFIVPDTLFLVASESSNKQNSCAWSLRVRVDDDHLVLQE